MWQAMLVRCINYMDVPCLTNAITDMSRGIPSASEPGTEILKNRLKRCLSGGLAGSCESSVMKEPVTARKHDIAKAPIEQYL